MKPKFDLNAVVLRLAEHESLVIRDLFEGVCIFGGNGVGKTSGPGQNLAVPMLKGGWGGLVLTAKTGERDRWVRYCADAGRLDDLIEFRPGGEHCFNVLDYEFRRAGPGAGLTYDIVHLLQTAADGGAERRAQERYWDDKFRQDLTNAIDLVALATGRLGLADVVRVLQTAPQSLRDADSFVQSRRAVGTAGPADDHGDTWAAKSFCAELMRQALAREHQMPADRAADLAETLNFWLYEFAGLDPRTRSCAVSTAMARLSGLLRSPFRQSW